MKKNWAWVSQNPGLTIAIVLVALGILSIITYLSLLSVNYTIGYKAIKIAETGAVGDFVGGFIGTIFSLAGFIVVYLTFIDQKKTGEKDKIENRFFTLLQIHVNNANSINYNNPYDR